MNSLRVSLASPEHIRSWSSGEVTVAETINYRTLKPERDGLFCERIFGPTKNWHCACGKYKRPQFKGKVCDVCGVLVAPARVRRERMGHIELAVPVSHVWYARGTPSRIALLLDFTPSKLHQILSYTRYIVLSVDENARLQEIRRIEEELAALELDRGEGEAVPPCDRARGDEAVPERDARKDEVIPIRDESNGHELINQRGATINRALLELEPVEQGVKERGGAGTLGKAAVVDLAATVEKMVSRHHFSEELLGSQERPTLGDGVMTPFSEESPMSWKHTTSNENGLFSGESVESQQFSTAQGNGVMTPFLEGSAESSPV